MKVKVLLTDDHQMIRQAVRIILERDPNIEVVGEASEGQEAIAMARQAAPDVVCMDVSMPGMDGMETTRRLLAISPSTRIVGLSGHADPHYVMEMLDAGASGYVTKSEPAEEIRRAVHAVYHSRKNYLCPSVAVHVVDSVRHAPSKSSSMGRLSHRELQVLHMVAEGCSSIRIAQDLHLATSTVEVHRRNIMRKINLHSIADLTRFAIRNGIAEG